MKKILEMQYPFERCVKISHSFIIVLLLLTATARSYSVESAGIPLTELAALEEFYVSTDGSNWEWKPVDEYGSIWNFTSNANPCADSWQGIVCTDIAVTEEYRHVIELNLAQYRLLGSIPNAIGNLTYLEVLSLPHNHLQGSIPDIPWRTMSNLTVLDLSRNRLVGAAPKSISLLSHLIMLDLGFNRISGSIPAVWSQLSQLQYLYTNNNRFTMRIPSSLSNLTSLQHLYLLENFLSGPIPDSLGQLPALTQLILTDNDLTGTIPPSLGQLSNLKLLHLGGNYLNGTLPASLCDLTQLVLYETAVNALTGTLPACVGDLHALRGIDVGGNQLHGTLPASWGNLVQLVALGVSSNAITGTIPAAICAFSNLTRLYFDHNMLTGTIPECIGNMSQVTNLAFNYNSLVGTIPASLGLLPNMITMWYNLNYLTGTIPEFGIQRNLTEMYVDYNYLTGALPDCFAELPVLQALAFSDCYLTGTIPSSLGQLGALQLLYAEDNLLSGSLSITLTGLTQAQELFFSNNHLSGSLDGVFSAAAQGALLNLFIDSNELSGTLPDELFLLPRLNTIVAQDNCFTGTLSPAICASPAMASLILDGLHTSTACRQDLLPTSRSYDTVNDVHGTIPACLFSMPALASLHLAGNGFTGTLLSDTADISAQLVDLAVSHNSLTGTIPLPVQAHAWRTLDLSFNRLTGSLQSTFGESWIGQSQTSNQSYSDNSTSLALQNNRLSGRIPSALVHMENVTILGSNMFTCNVDKRQVPKHDGDRDNYQCGSDAFNGPFFVVLALGVTVLSLLLLMKFREKFLMRQLEAFRSLLKKWSLPVESLSQELRYVNNMSDLLCQIAALCTTLIVVVLVPWYVAASHYYGTYAHQYAWVVSAAFLSGVTPTAVEFVLYSVIVLFLIASTALVLMMLDWRETQCANPVARSVTASLSSPSAAQLQPLRWRLLVYAAFLAINIAVVAGVNAGFVAAALTQTNAVVILAQILLSLFKLAWNVGCVPYLIAVAATYETAAGARASRTFVSVQVFTCLFNNIAIPCLVVAVLSPSCFNDVFVAPPDVNSQYYVENCFVETEVVQCSFVDQVPKTSTFSPPFRYDYQCSSSFITYYAPAFVYLGLAAGFIVPIANAIVVWLLQRAAPVGNWRTFLSTFPSRLLLPEQELAKSEAAPPSIFPLFDVNGYVISQVTYLGILMTYGVVFPPLAVVMCATMLSVAWQAKLSLGRFLHFTREQGAPQLAEALDRVCKGGVDESAAQQRFPHHELRLLLLRALPVRHAGGCGEPERRVLGADRHAPAPSGAVRPGPSASRLFSTPPGG